MLLVLKKKKFEKIPNLTHSPKCTDEETETGI